MIYRQKCFPEKKKDENEKFFFFKKISEPPEKFDGWGGGFFFLFSLAPLDMYVGWGKVVRTARGRQEMFDDKIQELGQGIDGMFPENETRVLIFISEPPPPEKLRTFSDVFLSRKQNPPR